MEDFLLPRVRVLGVRAWAGGVFSSFSQAVEKIVMILDRFTPHMNVGRNMRGLQL